MEQRMVLVKYGEIHLKGLNRPYFKRLLRQRLQNNLEGMHCQVLEMQGRVFVSGFEADRETEVVKRCANTFGVVGVSPAARVDKTMDAIAEAAVAELKDAMAHRALLPARLKCAPEERTRPLNPTARALLGRSAAGFCRRWTM
ncbi:MAG: hypothetical protein ACLT0Y_00175 [Christensenellales bacterium]